MKKVVLCVCAGALVTATAVNVNLALNSGSYPDLTLTNIVSLTQGENPGGSGGCPTTGGSEIQTYPNGKIASTCVYTDCGAGNGRCYAFSWWQSYDEGGNIIDSGMSEWNYNC